MKSTAQAYPCHALSRDLVYKKRKRRRLVLCPSLILWQTPWPTQTLFHALGARVNILQDKQKCSIWQRAGPSLTPVVCNKHVYNILQTLNRPLEPLAFGPQLPTNSTTTQVHARVYTHTVRGSKPAALPTIAAPFESPPPASAQESLKRQHPPRVAHNEGTRGRTVIIHGVTTHRWLGDIALLLD